MDPSASEDSDESREHYNLGAMLGIALAAVVGTTLSVWGLHFLHISTAAAIAGKPLPRIAVLPFRSVSASPDDIQLARELTKALIGGQARISRVEALPAETDADPVIVGQELGVKTMLFGKVERLDGRLRVNVQIVNTRDGSQVWANDFDGTSDDLAHLSARIESALASHLTALLD